jgi:phage gp16-like protein
MQRLYLQSKKLLESAKMSNAMKSKIHAMKKQIGLDDETYREILRNLTGYETSAALSKDQLAKVIDYLTTKTGELTQNASKNELLSQIDTLLKAQKKHRNYAVEILSRITRRNFAQASVFQLQQVVKALETQM